MPVHYELGDEHVVWITIDRPEAMNSMDMDHFAQLRQSWERFDADEEAWVAIVTGVGNAFCTGADLKKYIPEITKLAAEIGKGDVKELNGYRIDDGTKAVLRGVKIYKPIIAAVNGACVAGGMEMLGGCDIRVACPEAYFGVMEPKRGLFAGGGTTVRLPRQIAYPAAMEFLLCADRIPAEQAMAVGLLNAVVPREQLRDKAIEYARRITANGPLAVRKTKESVLRGLATDMREAYKIESAIATEVFSSEDAKEGPAAFAEKRTPNWKGR
ncbi:MAG: enoyl-CoA hydratase-related protein [Acidimicrobiales bacterium]